MPTNLFEIVVASNPELSTQLKLLNIKEGPTTTVSLLRNMEDDTLFLYTSGQSVAGNACFLRGDQKMLGHFGILLNKNVKTTLSVGFGSGESTACIALHKPERADCVEIAPEIVQLSLEHFKEINLRDRLDDEINMIYMDAKNYIHLTDMKYDAITNDSIDPRSFAENASLYTKEYYESARDHLNKDGLFLSWLPANKVMTNEVFNSIIGTMMDVFPYVTIWYMIPEPGDYFLVVGSKLPQYFPLKHIENELEKKGVAESLSHVNINNSVDIMSCYIGDKEDLMRAIKDHKTNSDYSPFIEFSIDNQWAGAGNFKKFIMDVRSDSVFRHIDWEGYSEDQKQQWLSKFEMLYEASTYLLLTKGSCYDLEKIGYCLEGLSILPDNPALLSVKKRLEQKLLNESIKLIEKNHTAAALNISENLLNFCRQSVTGQVIRSRALLKKGDLQQAHEAIEAALRNGATNPEVHFQMGRILSAESQLEKAIAEFQEALRLGENDYLFTTTKKIQVLKDMADSYVSICNTAEAIKTTENALKLATLTGHREKTREIKKFLESLNTKS